MSNYEHLAMARENQSHFQAGFLLFCVALCFVAPRQIAPFSVWSRAEPLLLFLGLFTLINAPFHWFSLGLTRALLRRGLERRGWWSYAYALLDAAIALAVIAVLAVVMLLVVQTFDDIAVHAGGSETLNLDELLIRIRKYPRAPENYWVYFTLFSTMIPSLANLCIGSTALLRGAPPLTHWLLRLVPPTGALPRPNIQITALLLTGQGFLGVVLAILAQGALFFGLIGFFLPAIKVDLLEVCQFLADENIPLRVGHLLGAL